MLATVASITSANRIKRCAINEGVTASVIQTPVSLTKEGCGYSVRFNDSSKKIITSCAQELHIKIRSYFVETEKDGKKTYLMV